MGAPGWLTDDLRHQIENDPAVQQSILLLERADDSQLNWLYRNCRFTLYPSLYEGWGLGSDEIIDLYNSHDVTVQWCVVKESDDQGHDKGSYNFGLISVSEGSGSVSIHHNLLPRRLCR